MKNVLRIAAALVTAGALFTGFAGTASAAAVFETEFHVRACGPDAVDLWEDCHGNPVEGYTVIADYVAFWWQNDSTCVTDANGNCSFSADSTDMNYSVHDNDPADFIEVVCSSDGDNVTFSTWGDNIGWYYESQAVDTLVVCDLYIYDETVGNSGGDAGAGGAELPDTGAGVSGQSANLGLLLAGVVALGGLAVASRRAAVR